MPIAAGIAVLNFEVDVAHRGVEGSGIGVRNVGCRGDDSLLEAGTYTAPGRIGAGAATGEEDHVADSLLVAWRVFAEDDDGAVLAISDDADSGPDDEGFADAVAAFGKEDDSLGGGFLSFVDGVLDGVGVIADAVAVKA